MNEPKKLNIRIKFTPQRDKVAAQETSYIYHWHRIIGVALVVITTFSTLIYGAYNYCNRQNIAPQSASTAVKIKISNLPTIKNSVSQPQADNSTTAPADQKDNPSLTLKKELATAETIQVSHRSDILFTQPEVELFSQQIERFVIAKTVKNREPVGSINNLNFDTNNIATVYAYSHAVGLKDETLYYKWRLNGKNIAAVRLKIGSDRWRSYSRKFIQPHMQGEWSVSLENEKGETLAISRFQYQDNHKLL